MDGCSWLVETVFWCVGASAEMLLAAVCSSDVESVNTQNNERKSFKALINKEKEVTYNIVYLLSP